jgi:hypothetical protein
MINVWLVNQVRSFPSLLTSDRCWLFELVLVRARKHFNGAQDWNFFCSSWLPLDTDLFIWFSDEMGNYTGTLPGPAINKTTPGCLVKVAGWVLLFFPIILLLIMAN